MPSSPDDAEYGQLRSDRSPGDRVEGGSAGKEGERERKHRSHRHKKDKKHKSKSKHKDADKDAGEPLKRRREAGSESPESGEIVHVVGAEDAPQSKPSDADPRANGLNGTLGSDRGNAGASSPGQDGAHAR